MMHPHLLAAISSHGFGHIAQSAPVLNELARIEPRVKLTVQCAAPREVLERHLHVPFEHWPESTDLGMVNRDALTVLLDESARAYREFHTGFDAKAATLAAAYRARGITALFADVPYLPLAAAAHARIPAVALCSLNWADIYAHYLGDRPEAPALIAQMRAAYASARVFLLPEPSMPMADLPNTRRIGPVARLGRDRRGELCAALGIGAEQRLVLISLGGIPTDIGLDRWPRRDGFIWLVQREWNIRHPDARAWNDTGIPHIDVLCSADVLITKPGYGSFAESACNGVRVLYVARADWPEAREQDEWLPEQVPCIAVPRAQLQRGDLHAELQRLCAAPRPAPRTPTGNAEAARVLADML